MENEIEIHYKGEYNNKIIFKGTIDQCIRQLIKLSKNYS